MRTLVVMPTYNERSNIADMVSRIRTATPDVDLLIVDDGSPDGTGEVADEIADTDDHVQVMHRVGKLGLGTAYVQGFQWGMDQGYEVLCEMDADGSHLPEQLQDLLDRINADDQPDLVIGSRWVPGGRTMNWPKSREVLSRGANLYTRLALGTKVKDGTAGYRAYRASTLASMNLDTVESQGYCFQVDMMWRIARSGGTVAEVPITFVERTQGQSKMSGNIVKEALWRVTVWGVQSRFGRSKNA